MNGITIQNLLKKYIDINNKRPKKIKEETNNETPILKTIYFIKEILFYKSVNK